MIDAELASGRAAELIPEIEALVDEQPLREAFRAQLVIALYRAGRQVDALRVVQEYRQLLVEELGLDPTPALSELERRVLTHDATLTLAAPAGLPLRGYRLGERLGTGRDGTVYAAHLPGVERDLAIRVIREEVADSPEFVRSFEATAHQVASLRHPAIVSIHDYWREPGAAYLVMRRMQGGTLRDRLQRGALPVDAVATLAIRLGGALAAAAESGIIHGRVVPESVFYDEADDCYLSDFAVGPLRSDQSAGDDVQDFAALVGECLGVRDGAQPRTSRTPFPKSWHGVPRPSGDHRWRISSPCSWRRSRAAIRPSTGSSATRTRACGPSTKPTPPTSSAATT